MTWRPEDWRFDPQTAFDLDGRTAIVTGGASGLGRAIALGFGARNANVVVADIDEEGADEVVEALQSMDGGGDALAVATDVTDRGSLARVRRQTIQAFGGYEVCCAIPGINVREPVLDLDVEDWRDVIELNLTGVFLCAKVLGRHLVEEGRGSLITMASIRGIDGGPAQGPYSASKGGVIQLTKVLAAEWAPDVRVNALAPGYMKTPLVREAMKDEAWYDRIRRGHMLDRFGDPEEVVGGAIYLASDAASFVTGTVLTIDGGWTAR